MANRLKGGAAKKLNKPDQPLLIVIFVLLAFGLIMVFSASSASAEHAQGDAYYFIKKQLIWVSIGVCVMLFVSRMSYEFFYKYAIGALAVTIVLLLLVPLIGMRVNGAKRWLGYGSVSFQPSEVAKFTIVIFLARSLSLNKNALKTFWQGFIPYIAIIGIVAGLIFIEPHFSGAVVVAFAGCAVLWVGGAKLWHFLVLAVPVIPAGIWAVLSADYRAARLFTFLNPFEDLQGAGYQTAQSLLAIGSGGFFGLGLGQSRQKFLYLPEPQNDFIFSVICEELGFVGAIMVIGLFAFLIFRGVKIAINAPDRFSCLTVSGIMALITVQVLLNIAVVTSSVPATGMPLPFFSYGGSSMVFLLAEMGVVLSISRECEI